MIAQFCTLALAMMNFLSAIKESDAFFSTLSTFLIGLIAGMNAEQPFFSWECLKYRDFQSFTEDNLIHSF